MVYTYIQYQVKTEPVSTLKETVTESRWHQPWSNPPVLAKPGLRTADQQFIAFVQASFAEIVNPDKWYAPWREPVRVKPGLSAAAQQFLAMEPAPSPFAATGWFNWLAEPVRLKPGLHASQQRDFWYGNFNQTVNFSYYNWLAEPVRQKPGLHVSQQRDFWYGNYNQVVNFSYFNWFSEPVRMRAALRTGDQPFIFSLGSPVVSFGYYNWLSEPVRKKPGLYAPQHPFEFLGPAIQTVFPLSLNAKETALDKFIGVLYSWFVPFKAYVDIIEFNPIPSGYTGIVENAQQSGILAAITEPVSVEPAGIISPPVAAGARVAIVVSGI